jgi:hypothetical protein
MINTNSQNSKLTKQQASKQPTMQLFLETASFLLHRYIFLRTLNKIIRVEVIAPRVTNSKCGEDFISHAAPVSIITPIILFKFTR